LHGAQVRAYRYDRRGSCASALDLHWAIVKRSSLPRGAISRLGAARCTRDLVAEFDSIKTNNVDNFNAIVRVHGEHLLTHHVHLRDING